MPYTFLAVVRPSTLDTVMRCDYVAGAVNRELWTRGSFSELGEVSGDYGSFLKRLGRDCVL